jgi:hypothetical protein
MEASIEKRRTLLRKLLRLGLVGGYMLMPGRGLALGSIPPKLPPGRSIYKLSGAVWVNGLPATLTTPIHAGDHIRTGSSGRIIFVVGADAFLLRDNSELQLEGDGLPIRGMRMLTGKLLSVFGKSGSWRNLRTSTATIGIRGTGLYVESSPGRCYVCTCYGHTRIQSLVDPALQKEVRTRHHDQPWYLLADGRGERFEAAPVINHRDQELELIEELVGRKPPFVDDALFGGPDGGAGGY